MSCIFIAGHFYWCHCMIKILSAKQIKELDAYTIASEPIASIDLMERACRSFCSWFTDHVDPVSRVGIICGTGNNGGDGLGIARMLTGWDFRVAVWVVKGTVTESDDFKANLNRLKIEVLFIDQAFDKNIFSDCDVLIDALFGTGLSRPVEGLYAEVIDAMNQSKATRIAVDIPSGLFADAPSSGSIVKAGYTISFQLPKVAFFFADCYKYVGEWFCVDIGLSKLGIHTLESNIFLLTRRSIYKQLKPQKKFDHKGKKGHALLIAGSYGKMGAAILASRSSLRTGVGLLTIHVPEKGYSILQAAVPEAMASVDEEGKFFSTVPVLTSYDAIGLGPGIGKDSKTAKALGNLLKKSKLPMVLDADAINIIADQREFLSLLTPGTILTPHPKEFERIAGNWKNEFDRLDKQREFSRKHHVIVVLKGAFTSITTPDGKVFFNNTGNPGMATAGSGDVLTGVITALLAQGYTPLEAAQLGVWLHGLAGDEAKRKVGSRGMIASDIIDHLPASFDQLY